MQTRWNDGQCRTSFEGTVWTSSPIVRRYLHRLVSGKPENDWPTYVEWRHLPSSAERALVLGCGAGWLERALVAHDRFRSIVACDFAHETVERAASTAAARKLSTIEYRVLDLEHDEL